MHGTAPNLASPTGSLLKSPLWKLAAADEPGSPYSGAATSPRGTCTELNADEIIRLKNGLDAVDYQGSGELRWKDLMLLDEVVAGYRFTGEQFKAIDTQGLGVVRFTDIVKTWYPLMHARDVYRYCASHLKPEEVFHLKTAFDRITNAQGRLTLDHLHAAGYAIVGMRFSSRMYRTHLANAAGLSFEQVLATLFPRIPAALVARYVRTELAEQELVLLRRDFDAVAADDGAVTAPDLAAALVVAQGRARPLGGVPFDLRTFHIVDADGTGTVTFADVLRAFYPSIAPFDLQSFAQTYLTNGFQTATAFGTASLTALANHPNSPLPPAGPRASPRAGGRSPAQFNRALPSPTHFVSCEFVDTAASAAVHRYKAPAPPAALQPGAGLPKRGLSPLSPGSSAAASAPATPPAQPDPARDAAALLASKDAEIQSLRAQVANLQAQLARQSELVPDADSYHLFEYAADGDQNGYVYHVATRGGLTAFANPYWTSGIGVEGPVLPGVDPSVILDRPDRPDAAGPGKGLPVFRSSHERWLTVDLGTRLQPTHYALAQCPAAPAFGECYMVSWELHASADGRVWTSLSAHTDDTALCGPGAARTWRLRSGAAYRYFRVTVVKILLLGRDPGSEHNAEAREALCPFHGFEVYGYAPRPQGPKGTALGILYKASRAAS